MVQLVVIQLYIKNSVILFSYLYVISCNILNIFGFGWEQIDSNFTICPWVFYQLR